MRKLINWLKGISANPFIQKFYLIAFIAFCIYLVIPKWHISQYRGEATVVNRFTGEIQGENLRERISELKNYSDVLERTISKTAKEQNRLKARVNELTSFIENEMPPTIGHQNCPSLDKEK